MAKLTVYCEGTKNSWDYQILDKVFEGKNFSISALGGVGGSYATVQYIEKTANSISFIFFRDRDFDFPLLENTNLQPHPEKKYVYFGQRVTIENYLFNVDGFYQFVCQEKLNAKYNLSTQEAVNLLFINAAKQITEYQAVRHAMAAMRTEKTNFGTTWLDGSKELPEKLDLKYCQALAYAKIKSAFDLAQNWTEINFKQKIQEFLTRFQQAEFYNNFEFLIWFQGKNFAQSLQLLCPEFPLKTYYKYALSQFDYTLFPDLQELRELAN